MDQPIRDDMDREKALPHVGASFPDNEHPDITATKDSDFPAQTELNAAIAHFRGGRTGAPEQYKRPFTLQLKSDTALRFQVDKKYFDRANVVQQQVINSYGLLRAITFVLFLMMLVVQVSLFGAAFTDKQAANVLLHIQYAAGVIDAFPLPSAMRVATASALILIASVFFFFLRINLRKWWFRELSRDAHQLSFEIFTRLDEISTRVTDVCSKVRDRVGKGGDWPERARKWTTIALWNAKHGEYLDRFITTVIWKVQTSIQDAENLSMWVKSTLSLMAFAVALTQARFPSLVFGLFIGAQTYLFWHRFGRQRPDFWTVQFRKSAPADDDNRETYVDKIGAVVENLVHEALSKEFGQGGKKP